MSNSVLGLYEGFNRLMDCVKSDDLSLICSKFNVRFFSQSSGLNT